jgi:DNA-binding GntR family transcriptional regulator
MRNASASSIAAAHPGETAQAVNIPERIRGQLEREIEAGRLAPGCALDEIELARRFEVSRTPVREALLMLAAQKLVSIVPRSGVYVHRPTASELVALLECLGEFEGVAARLAALRMGEPERRALMTAHKKALARANAGDVPGYETANLLFHELIQAGSANPLVAEQVRGVRRRLSTFRRRVLDTPGRLVRSRKEHERIVAAILAGDGDAAADAMREHILGKGQAYADLILANP